MHVLEAPLLEAVWSKASSPGVEGSVADSEEDLSASMMLTARMTLPLNQVMSQAS